MTLPPRQLIGLHLRTRQAGRAALLLSGTAITLRASHRWTADTGLFSQVTLLLLVAAGAAVIATGTGNPFGETENTAGGRLPALRLTHLLALSGAAAATTALAGLTATYAISGAALLRDLAGLTGLALLTAVLAGAHLAWVSPLGYVVYCGGELDLHQSTLWAWPTRAAGDRAATLIAAALLAAGLFAVCAAGARDRRTERG